MTLGEPRPWQASVVGPRLARIWGIDSTVNSNAWRASPESILKCSDSFVGKPGVLYQRCSMGRCVADHPPGDPSKPCAHILEVQEPYRVSTIVKVEVEEGPRVFLTHEVHSDSLWERIRSGPPAMVSPSLCPSQGAVEFGPPDEWGRPVATLTEWMALHVAFVDTPAYGPKAQVRESCEGDQCPSRDSVVPPRFAVINSIEGGAPIGQPADDRPTLVLDAEQPHSQVRSASINEGDQAGDPPVGDIMSDSMRLARRAFKCH